MEIKRILIDFDRFISNCGEKKAKETSEYNWLCCTFDEFLEETVYFFSDGQTRLYVKLELEYGSIIPLVFIAATKKKVREEGEIRRFLQLVSHGVLEMYNRMEKE